jgi:hypothetical protein
MDNNDLVKYESACLIPKLMKEQKIEFPIMQIESLNSTPEINTNEKEKMKR